MIWKNLKKNKINLILQKEDIEGFIELGAPGDEYLSEAIDISEAIQRLPSQEFTHENVLAILSAIWAKNFNLDDANLNLRLPSLQNLAKEILKY